MMGMNFEMLLVLACAFTGVLWLWNKLMMRFAGKAFPKWLGTVASFFPVLLLVLLIRSFIFEPFRIPSGSLKPTLDVGDFILVNKFDYGLRWPIWNKTFYHTTKPKTGDIVVFYWPANSHYYFIKRIVAVPGDKISYVNKTLYINGKPAKQKLVGQAFDMNRVGDRWVVNVKTEDLNGVKHKIWLRPDFKPYNFKNIVVPKGMYFMMGDNRDDSEDSRYWGFVPSRDIVGKASVILFSWNGHKSNLRWDRFFKPIH